MNAIQWCGNCVYSSAVTAYNAVAKFTEEVRANSEDDDTMISLEQIEKEKTYESIDYHRPHTEAYEEFLKRKRLSRLIKNNVGVGETFSHQMKAMQGERHEYHHGDADIAVTSSTITSSHPKSPAKKKSHVSSKDDDNTNTSIFDDDDDVHDHNNDEKTFRSSFASKNTNENSNKSNSKNQNTAESNATLQRSGSASKFFNLDELGDEILSDAREKTLGERIAQRMEESPWMIKWIMHIVLALCVGCFVASVSNATSFFEEWRLETVEAHVLQVRKRGDTFFLAIFEGLLVWLFSAVFLVGVGTGVVVFIEPAAGGSGLPQVMAYLNGVLMRGVFSLKVFVIKTISVIGAVSGGLPCGAEAPFVHLGALIGAGVSSGRSRALNFQTSLLQGIRNSKDRRDFVTAGAACGVAAAFGSPIGGMLFVMEEASIVWDLVTSTQIFLGSMTAFTAMAILDSILGEAHHGYVSRAVSVMFQVQYAGTIPLNISAVVPAIVLGAICGGLTTAFTKINLYCYKLRQKYISPKTGFTLAEPIVIVIIFAFLNFVIPLFLPCRDLISHDESASKLNGTQVDTAAAWFTENETVLNTFMCHDPTEQYSPLATLSTGLGKRSIRRLLSRRTIEEFPLYVLIIYFATYFSFGAYINGSAIASGLIIPFIVMGSTVGRAFGLCLIKLFAQSVIDQQTGQWRSAYFLEDSWMDPGVYALIGAGAFIGGATRMTISIPVIMVELSGELRFLLPIMVAIAVARAVADTLCAPLYHQQMHLSCIPYLPHSVSGVNMELFTLKHLISNQSDIAYLSSKPTLQEILDLLKDTNHHMFPVIELPPPLNSKNNNNDNDNIEQQQQEGSSGAATNNNNNKKKNDPSLFIRGRGSLPVGHQLVGAVSREDLQIMLALPDFDIGPHAMTRFQPTRPYNELRYEEWIEHENSMFFLLSTQEWRTMWNSYVPHISEERANQIIDLRVILNKSPWTAVSSQSLAEAFHNVRTMSIRHLIVVENQTVIGIVTRKDLLPYRLRQLQSKLDSKLLHGIGLDSLEALGEKMRNQNRNQQELKESNSDNKSHNNENSNTNQDSNNNNITTTTQSSASVAIE